MSEPFPARILLAPSRARRRLLHGCALANAALGVGWTGALLLQSVPVPMASWLPAGAFLAAALATLVAARAGAPHRLLRLEAAPPEPAGAGLYDVLDKLRERLRQGRARPWRSGPAPALEEVCLRGARAAYAGPMRIVLEDGRRRVVVWRDATDRDTFRRLAAWARWRTGNR